MPTYRKASYEPSGRRELYSDRNLTAREAEQIAGFYMSQAEAKRQMQQLEKGQRTDVMLQEIVIRPGGRIGRYALLVEDAKGQAAYICSLDHYQARRKIEAAHTAAYKRPSPELVQSIMNDLADGSRDRYAVSRVIIERER